MNCIAIVKNTENDILILSNYSRNLKLLVSRCLKNSHKVQVILEPLTSNMLLKIASNLLMLFISKK